MVWIADTDIQSKYTFGIIMLLFSIADTGIKGSAPVVKAWGLFGQAAVSDGNPTSIKWSVLGGVGGTSPLPGRPNDKFGVGIFYYGYSNELKSDLIR